MKVVNTIPFRLIYSIVEHPHLGYLIEPHVVQVNSLGNLTLSHERLFPANLDYYEKGLDDTDRKLVVLLEALDQSQIIKRFYNKGHIRPVEYFKKHFDPQVFLKLIRPFIEKRLVEVIALLPGKPVFEMGKDGNPGAKPVRLAPEKASVLFHFRREEAGTNYFPTLKCGNEKVQFKGKGGILLVNQPAWLLSEGVLYSFEKNLDGNKLRPFLNKQYIHIPRSTEYTYFQKFVVPLIEKFDVYPQGFEIRTDILRAVPVIQLDNSWGDGLRINLSFSYDGHLFPFASNKKVSVFLEKKGEDYLFHRIRRNTEWENRQKQLLEDNGLVHMQGMAFRSPDRDGLDWLQSHFSMLENHGFQIQQDQKKRYFVGDRFVDIRANQEGDWFDVDARVVFGEFVIPFLKFRPYIIEGKKEFTLPNGEIAIIPDEWFAQFSELMELSSDQTALKVHKHHYALIGKLGKSRINEELRQRIDDIENWELKVPQSPGIRFEGELRPYQLDGFRWLYFLRNNRFGGCLADDMGLGKTIQALALLASESELEGPAPVQAELPGANGARQISLFDALAAPKSAEVPSNGLKPVSVGRRVSLVVAPTSLVYNWMRESARFVPGLRVLVHGGANRDKNAAAFGNYDIVITTYGVLRLDIEWLKQVQFHYLILDESQAIKNPASLTYRAAKELQGNHRLVLTGTPIENSVTDLWSQMSFVNPGLLGSYNYFQKRFVIPIEKEGRQDVQARLHELIAPFVLRRTKREVARDLPDKYELTHYCEMTPEQEKLYEETKSVFRNAILKTVTSQGLMKSKLQILKGLILLRQISNHPRLSDPAFLGESGKFIEITRMLETAMQEGHKILLFSQFVRHLALFRDYFDGMGISYAYLDGSTPVKERMKIVERFNTRDEIKLFLISLKAGGTGLNLTSADYVFLADPWWNPAVEQQAIDRAHRIGQTQKVFSYKFITKNSVEEKIVSLQQKKLALAGNIIDTDDAILRNLDIEELEELLV